jgi:NAD(P)-dependent dehydrogenase (short-subunit alcohol dehydrogenase family)
VVDAVMVAFGRLDILFNNAGVSIPGNVENITVEIWERELGVDAKGVFLGTRKAMPVLTGSLAPKIRPNAARWFLYGPHPEGM